MTCRAPQPRRRIACQASEVVEWCGDDSDLPDATRVLRVPARDGSAVGRRPSLSTGLPASLTARSGLSRPDLSPDTESVTPHEQDRYHERRPRRGRDAGLAHPHRRPQRRLRHGDSPASGSPRPDFRGRACRTRSLGAVLTDRRPSVRACACRSSSLRSAQARPRSMPCQYRVGSQPVPLEVPHVPALLDRIDHRDRWRGLHRVVELGQQHRVP